MIARGSLDSCCTLDASHRLLARGDSTLLIENNSTTFKLLRILLGCIINKPILIRIGAYGRFVYELNYMETLTWLSVM